ncbi:MAG: hypothetical protein M3P23_13625 [Actinomycetota bacterium]|nr:hypothetical protein [Actinomycetota bacterium]
MKKPLPPPAGPAEGLDYVTYGQSSLPVAADPLPAVGQMGPYGAYPPPAPPTSGHGRRLALGIVSVVIGFVITIALVAYLVPRAMAGRPLPASAPSEVTVTLPTHLHGWTKMDGRAETQMMKKSIDTLPDQVHARGAVYGRAGVYQAIVIVETGRLSLFQQKAALQSDARFAKGYKVTMRAVPPGPLGGLMQCGRSTNGAQTICDFADDGLYAYVALMGQPKDYLATVHAVRAAIEHRLG